MKSRAAIYCRLSVEDYGKENKTEESESIYNQRLLLTDYAQRQNWQIFKIYSDECDIKK